MCKKTKNILCFGELLNVIYWILSKVGMSQGQIKKVYTYILYIPLFLVDYSLSSIKKIYLEILFINYFSSERLIIWNIKC
jgi:hypothetical protein